MVDLDHAREQEEKQRQKTEAEADKLLEEKMRREAEAEARELERQRRLREDSLSLVSSPERSVRSMGSFPDVGVGMDMDDITAARIKALRDLAALKQRQIVREAHSSKLLADSVQKRLNS